MVKIPALPRGLDVAGADGEVAEMLARIALARVAVDDWLKRGDDLLVGQAFPVEFVQPVARESAAQVQVVLAKILADQRDLGQVGPGAAIRATGHADDDVVLPQPHLFQFRFQRADKMRQFALALGQGKPATRQADAGHRVAAQAGLAIFKPVFRKQGGNAGLPCRFDVGDNHVLVRRKPEFALVLFSDGAQPIQRGAIQATVFHKQAEMPVALGILRPAIAVAIVGENDGSGRL